MEFKEKTPSQSGEHDIILCQPVGGAGFDLLVGMPFSVECGIVSAETVAPVFTPFLGWRGTVIMASNRVEHGKSHHLSQSRASPQFSLELRLDLDNGRV